MPCATALRTSCKARLDELLGDPAVDRLVRAARPDDHRAPAATRLRLDGRRQPAEHAPDRRLAHRRQLLLRVGDSVAQHVLHGVKARGGRVELVADRAEGAGHAPRRGGAPRRARPRDAADR